MSDAAIGSLKVDRSTKTLRVLTLEKMREAILNEYFQPGERLVERQLCELLDVSRTVVREVLRHLETEGLVESIPHQGPVVAVLNPSDAAQIYEIRALLEGHAAHLCAEKADGTVFDRLEKINSQIQEAFSQKDFARVLLHTGEFYETLFQGAGQPIAWEVVQSLNARINRLRAVTVGTPGRDVEAAQEMAAIIAALRQRNGIAAQEASAEHVRRAATIAAQKIEEQTAAKRSRLPAAEGAESKNKKSHSGPRRFG